MKSKKTTANHEKNTFPQKMSLSQHAAVSKIPKNGSPLYNSIETRFDHDFSIIDAKPFVPIDGIGSSGVLYPLLPQRFPSGGACPLRFQFKLKAGQSGDKYEKEADQVAGQIIGMPGSQLQRKERSSPSAKEYDENKISRAKFKGGVGNALAKKDRPLFQAGLSSSGQPLGVAMRGLTGSVGYDTHKLRSQAVESIFRLATRGVGNSVPYRSFMEAALGSRFDDVHAYLGQEKEMKALGAEAATRGSRIAFRDRNPSREVVAHELVHIIQQRRSGTLPSSCCTRLSEPWELAEREATRTASRIAKGDTGLQIEYAEGGIISRQTQSSTQIPEQETTDTVQGIPSDLIEKIEEVLELSEGRVDDSSLRELGQKALRQIGPERVVELARNARVPGAERREQELESESGGTIHRQAAAAAAATAATTWWLTLVDGPLPIGDIIFGALVIGAALAASQGIGKGPCFSSRGCRGRIYHPRIKHCHNCKNRYSGKSIRHPSGICENC